MSGTLSLGTSVSSTNKIECQDIAEILNTIILTLFYYIWYCDFMFNFSSMSLFLLYSQGNREENECTFIFYFLWFHVQAECFDNTPCFENGTFLAHQRQLEKLIIRFNLLKVVVFGLLVGKLSWPYRSSHFVPLRNQNFISSLWLVIILKFLITCYRTTSYSI